MAHTGPGQENNILYELLVHAEWPLEPEVHVSSGEQGQGRVRQRDHHLLLTPLTYWVVALPSGRDTGSRRMSVL